MVVFVADQHNPQSEAHRPGLVDVPDVQNSRHNDIFNRKRPLDVAGAHDPSSAPDAEDSCGHGTQREAAAGFCITPSETAAGILLEELGDIEELARAQDEGENGWNAQRRNEIARKMQRIAGGSLNRYSYDEIAGAVIRAERGELRG
jgi:hypothetical protein